MHISEIFYMRYYRSYSLLLVVIMVSIIGLGNIGSAIPPVVAQSNENGNPVYPYPVLHKIEMSVQKIEKPGDDLFGYQLDKHEIFDPKNGEMLNDITDRYTKGPTIPGPTLMFEEGDSVELTLTNPGKSMNGICNTNPSPENTGALGRVSIHVHGIHYSIASDGTLGILNGLRDEGVCPGESIKYHYTAGPGTAGTWPYHDHALGLNPSGIYIDGSETLGLFGNLVIESHTGKTVALVNGIPTKVNVADIAKDVFCYVTDDAFWCDEIDYTNNAIRTALWENPTIGAKDGDFIRFHLYGMGTDFHIFSLTGYEWLEPGTAQIIKDKKFGALENHVFTIQAKNGIAEYRDTITSHLLSGMKGSFMVDSVGKSVPGKSPLEGVVN